MRRLSCIAAALLLFATGCAAATTGSALSVRADSALVSGSFATDTGGQVETWVEYGPTTAYGFETQHHTETLDPGQFQGGISGSIDGLSATPSTTTGPARATGAAGRPRVR